MSYPEGWHTLQDVPVKDLMKRLQASWPATAWKALPSGHIHAGKRIVDANAYGDRVREVFGAMGAGWRFVAHPTLAKFEYAFDFERKSASGKLNNYHCVSMEMFAFEYLIIGPEGEERWCHTAWLADYNESTRGKEDAYRGVYSSFLKQAVRLIAGREVDPQAAQSGNSQNANFGKAPQDVPQGRKPGQNAPDLGGQSAERKSTMPPPDEAAGPGKMTPASVEELKRWAKATYALSPAIVVELLEMQDRRWSEWETGLTGAKSIINQKMGEPVKPEKSLP